MGNSSTNIRSSLSRGLWVAALMLVVQVVSQSHFSEFGIDGHSHDGVACAFVTVHEALDDGQPALLMTVATWESSARHALMPDSVARFARDESLAHPRAPPKSLLTA